MINIKSLYTLILLSCFTAALVSSCKPNNDDSDERAPYVIPDSLFHTLTIDTVKMSNVLDAIKFNGIVDFNADKVVNVFPLISGNVQDVHVKIGDYVTAGQVLGIVKSAEIANFNSALTTAEENITLTKRQLDQQNELAKSGLASGVDVTTAEVNYRQAIAAKVAAEQILKINGNNNKGKFLIKSPINGFIVQKNVTDDMAIRTDNGSGLFTISDLKNVWVEANVFESNIAKVHEGDSVQVTTTSYPGKVFKGKIDRLLNILDPTSKVIKMRVVLNNPQYLLKPQMFATVTVVNSENKRATSIPSHALVFDHSQYYVVVFKERKDLQIRPVEVLSTNGQTTYIKDGLIEGDKVVGSNVTMIYNSLNN